MYKQTTFDGTSAAIVVELGFVPNKLIITNIDTGYQLEWSDKFTAGEFVVIDADGTRTKTTSGTPITLIDGSDKTNNTDKSFGFILGAYANINDTTEHLVVEAFREDQV